MTTVVDAPSRVVPWLGAGSNVQGALTVEEAVRRSGLDFEVELRKTAYEENGGWKVNPDRVHIVRPDVPGRKGILGIASSDYEPVQYADAFRFMDEVSPHFVAAGPLRNGRQGYIVVQTADEQLRHLELDIRGTGDNLSTFVCLRTSHDLSRGIEITALMLRWWCTNQITGEALARGAPWRWSIRHVKGASRRLDEAQRVFANVNVFRDSFAATAERLAAIEVSLEEARETVFRVLATPKERPKTRETVERIVGAWQHSPSVGFFPTAWGLVNAVGEDMDWTRHLTASGAERRGNRHEARLLGVLQGANLKYTNRLAHLLLRRHA